MLMKMMDDPKKKYQNALRMRLVASIALLILGLVTVAIGFIIGSPTRIEALNALGIAVRTLSGSSADFYQGFGIGIMAAALILIGRALFVMQNSKARAKEELENRDERNQFILLRSAAMTYSISLFILIFAIVIAGAFNATVMVTLACVAVPMAFLFFIVILIYQRIS